MLTADSCKGIPFTYLWTIENVPKLTNINLKSPSFVARSIRKEAWYLQIIENEVMENAENCFRCSLRVDEETLQTDDENLLQEISAIDIEFSLLADDGSTLISKRSEDSKLYVSLLTSAAFSERRDEFIPNNKLIVQFRMWKRGYEILTTDFCYGRTKLMTYRRSFLWAVEEFSALHTIFEEDFENLASGEMKRYTLKRLSSIWPSMTLILYLKQSDGLENVNVDFVTGYGRSYVLGCEINILDANGKVIASKVENGCMEKNLKYRSLISRSELMANKNLYVPNGTLLLRCSFEIPFGDIYSRIEYCSQNVSSGVPFRLKFNFLRVDLQFAADDNPLEFEEYLINKDDDNDSSNMATDNNPNELEEDSNSEDEYYEYPYSPKKSDNVTNSCRDSCPFRASLKYLQNDATQSDFSLKIGTECYPVHRNILCSRIPVFKEKLSHDIVQKTIEIENMNENTLCRLLQYIYSDTVDDLNFADALDLYKSADFYKLLDLRKKCSYFLGKNLHGADLCEILSLANKFQDEELQNEIRYEEFNRQIHDMNSSHFIEAAEWMKSILNNDEPNI